MRIRVPPKRIRERFLIIYELKGCQKAVNFLTAYYGVIKMRIVLDGRKVPKNYDGYYLQNKAYFTKRGLKSRAVLHELYHHLVESTELDIRLKKEEKEANYYALCFGKR
jgi:hypothetical protein